MKVLGEQIGIVNSVLRVSWRDLEADLEEAREGAL